ncbi:MAG: pirin family protein [Burkholderiaceae bacterium]
MPTSDGAGVALRRVIGGPALSELDPFLLLDEFRSDVPGDYLAGFPNHPHRGFETVTYMLAGRMRHEDNQGNRGQLGPGSIQWMTAGKGIVHAEMPEQVDGLMWGFQLWVNLPATDKMCEPRYQDIDPALVPRIEPVPGASVGVLSGQFLEARGPVTAVAVEPLYLDVGLQPGAELLVPVPAGHAAFVYVFDGRMSVGSQATEVGRGHLAVLDDGDGVTLRAAAGGARCLVVAGRPLDEPVVRYGPFVMNTEQQIHEAIHDFQQGRF